VAATTGIFVFAVSAGIRAQLRKPTTGSQRLVGEVGVVRTPLDPEGQVFVRGEIWRAVADGGAIPEGERVQIVGVDSLTLHVTRLASG
jgi:membrane-bound serine protease (ClpP class)